MRGPGPYARFGKRALDIVAASLGIVLMLPLGALVAALIWCALGSPVLFRQRRPGLHGVPFTLVKFRSMAAGYDSSGSVLPDSERLTVIGRWLRATSLDEIPELWHVLTGEMSLVGPRPLLHEISAALHAGTSAQTRRSAPGHHGTRAQVSGRNGLNWDERFALDVGSVTHCSFALDLRILRRARRMRCFPDRASRSPVAPPSTTFKET